MYRLRWVASCNYFTQEKVGLEVVSFILVLKQLLVNGRACG